MSESPKEIVFLAVPCGSGEIHGETANSLVEAACSPRSVVSSFQGNSLLNFTFNILLCQALNLRKKMDITRFVMLHSDIAPKGGTWLDDLLDLLDEHEADVVSVVSPLKDQQGLTSVALDTDAWRPRRLTLKEVHELPETFGQSDVDQKFSEECDTGQDLLFNTGLMAFRLDQEWSRRICFESRDRIVVNRKNGDYEPQCQPEDWTFSRWCASQNLKYLVTRKIKLNHHGRMAYGNDCVWGKDADTDNEPGKLREEFGAELGTTDSKLKLAGATD